MSFWSNSNMFKHFCSALSFYVLACIYTWYQYITAIKHQGELLVCVNLLGNKPDSDSEIHGNANSQIATVQHDSNDFIKMFDLASGENRSLTCGPCISTDLDSRGPFCFSAGTKKVCSTEIDWERLERCISDIEAVRKTMYSDVTAGVVKVYWKLYETIWCLNRFQCQNRIGSWNTRLDFKKCRFKRKWNDVIPSLSLSLSPFEVDFIGGFDSYGYQPPQKSSHLQLQPLYTWVTNITLSLLCSRPFWSHCWAFVYQGQRGYSSDLVFYLKFGAEAEISRLLISSVGQAPETLHLLHYASQPCIFI